VKPETAKRETAQPLNGRQPLKPRSLAILSLFVEMLSENSGVNFWVGKGASFTLKFDFRFRSLY